MNNYQKYLKYKKKYLDYKNIMNGGSIQSENKILVLETYEFQEKEKFNGMIEELLKLDIRNTDIITNYLDGQGLNPILIYKDIINNPLSLEPIVCPISEDKEVSLILISGDNLQGNFEIYHGQYYYKKFNFTSKSQLLFDIINDDTKELPTVHEGIQINWFITKDSAIKKNFEGPCLSDWISPITMPMFAYKLIINKNISDLENIKTIFETYIKGKCYSNFINYIEDHCHYDSRQEDEAYNNYLQTTNIHKGDDTKIIQAYNNFNLIKQTNRIKHNRIIDLFIESVKPTLKLEMPIPLYYEDIIKQYKVSTI